MQNLKDRVTIYQVAQAAGVSLATVSRVINNSESVTPATRKKVQETIESLGYKPSGLAQALATNRSTNIGVIIPSANYVYLSNLLSGITDIAKEKNYQLTLFTTSHSRDEALNTIEKVITAHVDGTIIFDDQLSQEDVEKITSYNVPSVVIDNKIKGDRVADIRFSYDSALEQIIKDYYARGRNNPMAFLLHLYCSIEPMRRHQSLHILVVGFRSSYIKYCLSHILLVCQSQGITEESQ